jgi:molecular chaperone GrpE
MNDEQRLDEEQERHEEAEEIREQTAAAAPELQEHDRFAQLEKELEEARQATLYARAETQNVRRRLEQEKHAVTAYAVAGFARELLTVKDNLDRALEAAPAELREDEHFAALLTGIEATARELDNVFQRHGIQRIDALGEELDPNRHQAMLEVPTDEAEPGVIVQEMQPGYMIKERLLRPALVGVARKA